LKDIVPTIKKVGMIMEKGQKSGGQTRDLLVQEAPKIGIEMFIIEIEKGSANEQKAIASLTKNKIDGYIACTCLDDIWPQLLVQLNKEKIPSINHVSAIGAVKGFLATYSTDHVKVGERVAEKIVEFFKGKTISQIPVEAAGKDFVLELNLKTAKIIGVTVPDVIRSTASKVYEE
jgi:ABC-type uncharacterized transport system substrate-binding protein